MIKVVKQNYGFKEACFAELVDQALVTKLKMVITRLGSRIGMSVLKEIFEIILVLRSEYR